MVSKNLLDQKKEILCEMISYVFSVVAQRVCAQCGLRNFDCELLIYDDSKMTGDNMDKEDPRNLLFLHGLKESLFLTEDEYVLLTQFYKKRSTSERIALKLYNLEPIFESERRITPLFIALRKIYLKLKSLQNNI